MVPENAVRVAWGSALVVFPGGVLSRCPHTTASRAARGAVRLLGARQVAQGLAGAWGVVPARWAAVPDALHAASMAALALASRRWRTAALADFVVAGAFAVRTARSAARHPETPAVLPGSGAGRRSTRFRSPHRGKPECHG
ncbi:hypothetical protein [Streptomyces sp. NPDC047028]|uniref:hypothetical protein n=1 Tax=Streptomyces sp. NPDC047028 TaxID=3155793 RepID=UPI0033CC5515